MEYARVTQEIAIPADRIWAVIGSFGGIAKWVAGVLGCVLEGPDDAGVVRLVTLGDRQVREQLLAIDDAARRLSYAVLPPHNLPVQNVRSTIVVESVAAANTRVTWFSEADMSGPDPDLTRRIEGFFAASLVRLEQLCDAG